MMISLRLFMIAVVAFFFSIVLVVIGAEFGAIAGILFFVCVAYFAYRMAKYSLSKY